jgi:HD-GYP domain-containing protein (c-di-GMP phosphodiesterase class II)
MVRFSDIIRIKSKDSGKHAPSGTPREGDKLPANDSGISRLNRSAAGHVKPAAEYGGPEVVAYFEKMVEKAIDVRERVLNDQVINPSPIVSDLNHIIERDLTDRLYEYAVSCTGDYDARVVHSVDVTFASVKVGEGLGYTRKRLVELGLVGFLENVGMYLIPASILNKAGKLSESEKAKVIEHPQISAGILSRVEEQYQWLADVAMQVHERTDGSGYPRGLQGTEISEFASIIGLVDLYIALIGKRPHREKFMQTEAIKLILKEAKGMFPSKVLKTFLNQISLFPINSYVRLNNKSIGKVISIEKNQPLRPAIELIYDGLGSKLERREIIRLIDNPLLYITDSLKESELL